MFHVHCNFSSYIKSAISCVLYAYIHIYGQFSKKCMFPSWKIEFSQKYLRIYRLKSEYLCECCGVLFKIVNSYDSEGVRTIFRVKKHVLVSKDS